MASPTPAQPIWATCLDIENQAADHYLDYVNEAMYQGLEGQPGRVLELGCAGGMFGKTLKDRHPGTHVTGIEAGHAAAAVASGRLDRVICARIEDVDFAAHGIGPGSFDHVIAGDVLEHLYNPWATLVQVRPLLAPGGHLVASIPNVRNLRVVAGLLLEGRFDYVARGLLDITHVRFFTLDGIVTMLRETGYVLEKFFFTLSRDLQGLYDQGLKRQKIELEIGRLKMNDVTQRELMELCTEQYVVRASVATGAASGSPPVPAPRP
jgi:2-polyprenyl-3-methyl-5-hydroxy-6-metoxy-1,4-benzoquinol methylase